MPVYEYRCKECGVVLEKMRAVDRRHDTLICECGGTASLTIPRPGRFQRGSGWASRMDGAPMPGGVE